ncbi:MAG: hypothetical protein IJT59_07215, partial [Desulfovibrionaceae bacterium]|nr:hypothetical protein [Desulfovibrionaceae bacterium]
FTPDVRQSCDKTAMVLNVIYEALVQHMPEEDQASLALAVQNQPAAPNPQLEGQMQRPGGQHVVPIQRNATPAEIFAAKQAVLKEGWDKEPTAQISQMIETLKCTDYKLLYDVRGIGNTIGSTLGSLHKTGDYASAQIHYLVDLQQMGAHLNSLNANYSEHSPNELMKLHMDMFIAAHTDEQLAKVLDGLTSKESKLFLDVLATHATKEAVALQGAKSEKLEVIWQVFGALPYLADKIAEKLGREKPGPLLSDSEKTILDLPKQNMRLAEELVEQFSTHLNLFDGKMFMIKADLDSAKYERLKNFYSQLKLPAGANQPRTVGEAKIENYFYANIEDADDDQTMWNVEHLAVMFAFHAKELDALLDASGGNPTPQALWGVLHGGEAPQNLSMDNFVEKLMQRTVEEVNTYAKMINAKMVYPDAFINLSYTVVGISPNMLLQKFSKVAHEDVTISMNDQLLRHGLFHLSGSMAYKNGDHAYGFGYDFPRAIMPLGENRKDGEGCKISVVVNGQEKVFTQKEYKEFTKEEEKQGRKYGEGQLDHPYMQQIVNAVRPLCHSDEQLASVGLCTTQAVQQALRNPKNFYKDVSGRAFEHTALDHRIEPLDDGNVKVTVTEKPGAFFKFSMEIVVDKEGKITMNKGEVTYPSYDKWQEYKRTHPEERLD